MQESSSPSNVPDTQSKQCPSLEATQMNNIVDQDFTLKSCLEKTFDSDDKPTSKDQLIRSDVRLADGNMEKSKEAGNLKSHKQMTPKECFELRKEIQSESQKMTRERNISLPYHKPRAHSLEDFLSKRSRLVSSPLTGSLPPSVAIKLSGEQLYKISQKLKQREKEVEDFYMSENDSESETDSLEITDDSENIESSKHLDKDLANHDEEKNACSSKTEHNANSLKRNKVHEQDDASDGSPDDNTKNKPTENSEEKLHSQSDFEMDKATIDKNQSEEVEFSGNRKHSAQLKSTLEIHKEKLLEIQPRLSGGPDNLIDLNSSLSRPKEIVQLMERFVKHANTVKENVKERIKLSIVTVEQSGIQKETIAMNNDKSEKEKEPGVKLHNLKRELQKQIEEKKSEIWRQKTTGNHENGYTHQEFSDDNETDEESLLSNSSNEMDEEFCDTQKDCSSKEILLSPSKIKTVQNNEESSEEYEKNKNMMTPSENFPVEKEHLKMKTPDRKTLNSGHESDDEVYSDIEQNEDLLDSTVTADEEEIPSHQPRQVETSIKQVASPTDPTDSISKFLTPISYITSIQNLTSAAKLLEPSSLSESQESDGGVFNNDLSTVDIQVENHRSPSTQELMDICSGEFTDISDHNKKQFEDIAESRNLEKKSDQIISQLLDEEEMEKFKKQFESPLINTHQDAMKLIMSDDEDIGEIGGKKKTLRRIIYSDDESSSEETEETNHAETMNSGDMDESNIQKRNSRFDSTSENDESSSEETKDLSDEKINLGDLDSEDSNPEKAPRTLFSKDFLDLEAELSESEWGSEDEDEEEADKLEYEIGDMEKFDEEQIKHDLEKIHMRRMLDDDAREVQYLQEILLDDGEMHGSGRQRQFKWKNKDAYEIQSDEKALEEDLYIDEGESEEQWRKKRHEREMFLKENAKKSQSMELVDDDLLTQSQLLKVGKQVLEKSGNKSMTHSSSGSDNYERAESKRGSFLSRDDQVLQRVGEYTRKTECISLNSTKNTKNFVFHSLSVPEINTIKATNKRKFCDGTPRVLKKLRLSSKLSSREKKIDSSEGKTNNN